MCVYVYIYIYIYMYVYIYIYTHLLLFFSFVSLFRRIVADAPGPEVHRDTTILCIDKSINQ